MDDRLLKVRKRAKHEVKPICPACGKPPTSRNWSDDWLHWHQIHWCPVVREQAQHQVLQTQTPTTAMEYITRDFTGGVADDYHDDAVTHTVIHDDQEDEDDSQNAETISVFPLKFSMPFMYRTRSQAAAALDEAVPEDTQLATNVSSTSILRGHATSEDGRAADCPAPEERAVNNDGAEPSDEHKPLNLIDVARYILEKNRRGRAMSPEQDHQGERLSVHRQPSAFAVQQFLTTHPQANKSAVDDLLKLIKYLVKPELLMHTVQLPATRDALWREVYDSIDPHKKKKSNEDDLSETIGLQVSQVKLREDYILQLPHFDILAVLTDLILYIKANDVEGGESWVHAHTTSFHGTEHPDNLLYHEVYSGQWWKEVQQNLQQRYGRSTDKRILAVIPYMDGVAVDFFDSISMIPWVISVGNTPRYNRNKLNSKRLVAFIPNPSDEEIRLKMGVKGDVSSIRHDILNKCIETVLVPLQTVQRNGGFTIVESLTTSAIPVTYYPVIPFFIGDNKEQGVLAGVRSGHKTKRQCRICLCESIRLNDYRLDAGEIRNRDEVQLACTQGNKSISLLDLSVAENIDKFYLFQNPSLSGLPERTSAYYESFPPDNLHSIYAGIIRYCVAWTLDIVKAYSGIRTLYEIDTIFLKLYRCGSSLDAEFKFVVPKKGISKIAKLTRTKDGQRDIAEGSKKKRKKNEDGAVPQMTGSSNAKDSGGNSKRSPHTSKFRSRDWGAVLVALTFLIGSSPNGKFLPSSHGMYGPVRDIVTKAMVSVVHLLFELERTEYTEKAIRELEDKIIPQTLRCLYEVYTLRRDILKTVGDFHGIKLHIALHLPRLIRRFGTPLNWDTGTYESSHKDFVKKHWESGPKRTEDLELNTLKSYKFWCEMCRLTGVDCNGRMIPVYALKEKYTRTAVRRWRTMSLTEHRRNEETVAYKFNESGHHLIFREHDEDNPLSIRSRFEITTSKKPPPKKKGVTTTKEHTNERVATSSTATHKRVRRADFKPHTQVQSKLMELLLQFSEVHQGEVLSSAFQSKEHISLKHLRICMHESIIIKGEGAMEGYSDFKIYATNRYGKSRTLPKSRYDVVEVTCPLSSGGAIAGATDLMRISDDTAIARVLSIVTLHYYEREMCLLFLQFMKSCFPTHGGIVTRHVKKYLGLGCNIYYGKGPDNWIALYPILTLKGPALEIKNPYNEGFAHVLPMQFVCRGGWWPASLLFEEEEKEETSIQRERQYMTQPRNPTNTNNAYIAQEEEGSDAEGSPSGSSATESSCSEQERDSCSRNELNLSEEEIEESS